MNENTTGIPFQVGDPVIERKVGYDGSVVEHCCRVLKAGVDEVVLFHKIENAFTMSTNQSSITIPEGSYTLAYYWKNRAYNVYIWRDYRGVYLGSYFNIVRNTTIKNKVVSFEDLIIDVLVFTDGRAFVLDEEELPVAMGEFENGDVLGDLQLLVESLDGLLPKLILETRVHFPHDDLLKWLCDSTVRGEVSEHKDEN
ncbi:DUF402 domain-containing protein [Bacillus sp. BHET2]|uniref:DUF402 domain-containing protein n=1 Tax=Bacillus sp. BHET2 TaxID=2583818 RepID=UPI001F0F78ED|nr:DUF402 domain-containing protein [Bacillus sp. BHET2]